MDDKYPPPWKVEILNDLGHYKIVDSRGESVFKHSWGTDMTFGSERPISDRIVAAINAQEL